MTAPTNRIKAIIRKTPLFGPLKWLAALLGRSTYPLPFATMVPTEPFLERAIARIGHEPNPDRGDEQFYSYFSEIWDDSYEEGLARQYTAYLPHLPQHSNHPFLDIGCGAGEFVQFLNTHGFMAQGIDSNPTEVARAKERSLDVSCTDALSYLNTHLECFSGVSMIEVIEHMPPTNVMHLLVAIYRSLNSGGIALIETINIKNPLAFHTFYTDPTHLRPISHDYLSFLLQWVGFKDTKIIFTTPAAFTYEQRRDPTRAYFNYAITGIKP